MIIVRKKSTIFILISVFILVASFSFFAFTKNAYGYTADYIYHQDWYESGTDPCIENDYTSNGTSSHPIDYTDSGTGEHWVGTYNESWTEIGSYPELTYELWREITDSGKVYNAIEDNCGYWEWTNSGGDSYKNWCGEIRSYSWETEESYYYSCPGKAVKKAAAVEEPEEKVWVRDHEMECFKVWVNEDNCFEFVFWWEYKDNNHVQIFNMDGILVWETDFEKGKPTVEACLPDGTYTVKTFHEYGHILQEFVIGKP